LCFSSTILRYERESLNVGAGRLSIPQKASNLIIYILIGTLPTPFKRGLHRFLEFEDKVARPILAPCCDYLFQIFLLHLADFFSVDRRVKNVLSRNLVFFIQIRVSEQRYNPEWLYYQRIRNKGLTAYTASVPEPYRFDTNTDPDPRIRITGLRIRILRFSSVTFKMAKPLVF
jgi:hypothetical protein